MPTAYMAINRDSSKITSLWRKVFGIPNVTVFGTEKFMIRPCGEIGVR